MVGLRPCSIGSIVCNRLDGQHRQLPHRHRKPREGIENGVRERKKWVDNQQNPPISCENKKNICISQKKMLSLQRKFSLHQKQINHGRIFVY